MKIALKIILYVSPVLVVILYLFIKDASLSKQRKALLENGRFTIAKVIAITNGKEDGSSSTTPTYQFTINDTIWTCSGNSIIQKQEMNFFQTRDTGKKYFIIYMPQKPNTCSILPYCRPNDSLIAPNNGWKKLPEGKIELLVGTVTE